MSARVATNRLRGASAPPSGPRLTVNSPSAPSETRSFAHAARLPIGSTTTASATASEGSVASTSRGKGLQHERESSLQPTSDRPTAAASAATPKRQKPVIFPDIFITYLFSRFLFICPSFYRVPSLPQGARRAFILNLSALGSSAADAGGRFRDFLFLRSFLKAANIFIINTLIIHRYFHLFFRDHRVARATL